MDLYALDKEFEELLKRFPNARRELVENSGDKMYEKVMSNINKQTHEDTGNLKDGVQKVVGSGKGYSAVRPDWQKAPHTHLIENGHKIVRGKGKNSKVVGWAPGKHMYRNALSDLADELERDAEETLEKLVGEIFD